MAQNQPESHTFVALYRGPDLASATLVASSADPELAGLVARRLARLDPDSADPVLLAVRRAGLRQLVAKSKETNGAGRKAR
jgi:hypothetical protein